MDTTAASPPGRTTTTRRLRSRPRPSYKLIEATQAADKHAQAPTPPSASAVDERRRSPRPQTPPRESFPEPLLQRLLRTDKTPSDDENAASDALVWLSRDIRGFAQRDGDDPTLGLSVSPTPAGPAGPVVVEMDTITASPHVSETTITPGRIDLGVVLNARRKNPVTPRPVYSKLDDASPKFSHTVHRKTKLSQLKAQIARLCARLEVQGGGKGKGEGEAGGVLPDGKIIEELSLEVAAYLFKILAATIDSAETSASRRDGHDDDDGEDEMDDKQEAQSKQAQEELAALWEPGGLLHGVKYTRRSIEDLWRRMQRHGKRSQQSDKSGSISQQPKPQPPSRELSLTSKQPGSSPSAPERGRRAPVPSRKIRDSLVAGEVNDEDSHNKPSSLQSSPMQTPGSETHTGLANIAARRQQPRDTNAQSTAKNIATLTDLYLSGIVEKSDNEVGSLDFPDDSERESQQEPMNAKTTTKPGSMNDIGGGADRTEEKKKGLQKEESEEDAHDGSQRLTTKPTTRGQSSRPEPPIPRTLNNDAGRSSDSRLKRRASVELHRSPALTKSEKMQPQGQVHINATQSQDIKEIDMSHKRRRVESSTDMKPIPGHALLILPRSSMACLEAGRWLDDNVILYGLRLICSTRPLTLRALDPLLIDTAWSAKQLNSRVREDLRSTPKATILAPIHMPTQHHWLLAVVTPTNISIFDSLPSATPSSKLRELLGVIESCLDEAHGSETTASDADPTMLRRALVFESCARQDNAYDCGVAVLANAARVAASRPQGTSTASDYSVWRSAFAHLILPPNLRPPRLVAEELLDAAAVTLPAMSAAQTHGEQQDTAQPAGLVPLARMSLDEYRRRYKQQLDYLARCEEAVAAAVAARSQSIERARAGLHEVADVFSALGRRAAAASAADAGTLRRHTVSALPSSAQPPPPETTRITSDASSSSHRSPTPTPTQPPTVPDDVPEEMARVRSLLALLGESLVRDDAVTARLEGRLAELVRLAGARAEGAGEFARVAEVAGGCLALLRRSSVVWCP